LDLSPVLVREGGEGEHVEARLVEEPGGVREAPLERLDDALVWTQHRARVGLVEDRANHRVATMVCADFGTLVRRLRRRCTRHRCQPAPGRTAAMACSRPR
jgi:hypothetical protein